MYQSIARNIVSCTTLLCTNLLWTYKPWLLSGLSSRAINLLSSSWTVSMSHFMRPLNAFLRAFLVSPFSDTDVSVLQFSLPTTLWSSGTVATNLRISLNGLKPQKPINSLKAIASSGLWFGSGYLSGEEAWRASAWDFSGWACIDSALLIERTFRRKGNWQSNWEATFEPNAHSFDRSQSLRSWPRRDGGDAMRAGPFLCVPIHNYVWGGENINQVLVVHLQHFYDFFNDFLNAS